MHRIAAFVAVALAAAPAAAQYPREDYPHDHDTTTVERTPTWAQDDRYDGWQRRDHHPAQWHPLSSYANARDGSTFVRMPPYMSMTRVRIEGSHGAPVVTTVEVQYARYATRTAINRRLLRGQSVDVPIDPRRRIRAIIVHTDPRYRGGYSVWGS